MSSRLGTGAEDQLQDLQAVTEASLGRLGIDQLLSELLERVREIAEADTVAVLLLNERSQKLVARAASGIEEEVREGVQVPVGVGFAGRVALQRSAILLDRVDSTTVSNPILWERGIKVMLGVPLLAGQRVIGVLHVGRLRNRPFNARDVKLLEVVAERIAGAIQRRLLDEERAAATLFERSLLLERFPDCQGLEFAARYLTPEDRSVGGDWYDVFTLPSGELWLVAGDVAGHGLESAVVMGRLRSALRSYALLGGSPKEVLELTDRKARHFEIGTMATVVCASSYPPYQDWRITTAGHPPPVIAAPGLPASLLELLVDPPIGVGPNVSRSCSSFELSEDAVMLLYTDGLVERRGELLDDGFNRLCACVRPDHPEIVLHQVLQTLIGPMPPMDDVALVAVRRVAQTTTVVVGGP